MKTCGAKTRSGTPCKRRPCENGRCHLHGGKSLRGAEHPNFKHGLYSKYTPDKIKAKVADFLAADPFDLTSELALLRALLAEFLSRYEYAAIDSTAISVLTSLINDVGRLVERIIKARNETALTGAEVAYLETRILGAVVKYIDDPNKRVAFLKEIFDLEINGSELSHTSSDAQLPNRVESP